MEKRVFSMSRDVFSVTTRNGVPLTRFSCPIVIRQNASWPVRVARCRLQVSLVVMSSCKMGREKSISGAS